MLFKGDYARQHSLFERRFKAEKARAKHPNHIPVIVENVKNDCLSPLKKNKYLVPRDLGVYEFMFILRKNMQLKPEIALYLLAHDTMPPCSYSMGQVYEKHKDEANVLMLTISGEHAFG